MVNGYNLLGEVHAPPAIAKLLRKLPKNVRQIMFNVVLSLFGRVNKAIEAVEAYTYESTSRYKWRSYGGHISAKHSGFDQLGTNHVQRLWTFYNITEDTKVADESMWEGFKLVTSAQAPKGVKKIDDRDRQTRQLEKDRRQAILDRFYYVCKGVMKPLTKDSSKNDVNPNLMGSKSADDLAQEMHNWVSGSDDWHDQVVNNYKQRIVNNYEQHKVEAAERAAALAELHEQESGEPVQLVGYTPEQLADILKDRNPGSPGVRQVGAGMNGVRDHLYKKYLERGADPGALRGTEDGRIAIVDPEERMSLDEQIANRQVTFSVGED